MLADRVGEDLLRGEPSGRACCCRMRTGSTGGGSSGEGQSMQRPEGMWMGHMDQQEGHATGSVYPGQWWGGQTGATGGEVLQLSS